MENLIAIATKPDNIPIAGMLVLTLFYTAFWYFKAKNNDSRPEPIEKTQTDKINTWPYLVRVEFLGAIFIMIVLTIWSIYLDAPLEEPANPAKTPNPSKAPWYFLGLQEMLVYFDPWIAGVVLPSFIIIGLMAIPYLDINPKGNGYYTFKERKFAIVTYLFGFIVLWVFLIVWGTFFRGPGWNLFWPWQLWDPEKVVAITNVDFSELFGIPTRHVDNSLNIIAVIFGTIVILAYYSIGVWYYFRLKKKNPDFMLKFGAVRYGIVAFLFLTMMSLPVKIFLRVALPAFGLNPVKYILVTPWFNI
jgi:hypothetical protein